MQVKQGVSVVEMHPALRYALLVVEEEHHRVVHRGAVITGLQDGTHLSNSFHYGITYQGRKRMEADDRCRGADIRTRDFTDDERDEIVSSVRRRLGPDFDVVVELRPAHIHLEYDPKPV